MNMWTFNHCDWHVHKAELLAALSKGTGFFFSYADNHTESYRWKPRLEYI